MKSLSLSKTQSGFSLIELAMMLIIVGLLTVPLMQNYQVHKEREYRDQTYIAFQKMHSALATYVAEHDGAYPCPSDPSIAFNTPGHGVAVERCWEELALNQCDGAMCHRNGTGGGAFIGGFPYATLGVPYTDSIDGYKNFIRYTVSDQMVDSDIENPVGTIAYSNERGAVPESSLTHPYGFISAGANKKGAYNIYGYRTPCNNNTRDAANCDDNSDFVYARISLNGGSNYFDDILDFPSAAPTALWELSTENPVAIYNTNPGTVGIGTSTPDTSVRLDVAGDVKAGDVRAAQYCDRNGNNCTRSEVIAGDITRCEDPGTYLVAIVENRPICERIALSGIIAHTCPAGQFVTRISSSGAITCAAP